MLQVNNTQQKNRNIATKPYHIIKKLKGRLLMTKEKGILTNNEREVIKTFVNDEVRPDHYDCKNGLHRLSADLTCIKGIKLNEIQPISDTAVEDIKLLLSTINVPPANLFISHGSIEVDWAPNGFLAIKSKQDYLKLALEFASYIDSLDLFEFTINTGMFEDDPVEYDEYIEKIEKIQSPEFSSQNFGAVPKYMEVYDYRP